MFVGIERRKRRERKKERKKERKCLNSSELMGKFVKLMTSGKAKKLKFNVANDKPAAHPLLALVL